MSPRTTIRWRPAIVMACSGVLLLVVTAVGTFSAWSAGIASDASSVGSAISYPPPVSNDPPAIDLPPGEVQEGDELDADPGSWSGVGGEFTYEWQWQRCDAAGESCVDIPGATGQTYTPTDEDVQPGGHTLRVCVTATNLYGSTSVCSDPTGVIQARPVTTVTPPSITGQPHEGTTLSAGGEWDGTQPIEVEYQWLRCNASGAACVDVPDATQETYAVGRDDEGATLRVTVTASNADLPGGASVTDTSAQTGVVTVVSQSPESFFATDGTVNAIVRSGDTTYIGGSFSTAGKPTGSLAEIDLIDDQDVDMNLPSVAGGDIRAVEPDGAGGWFIGGSFTHVGGLARGYAAHILSNGSVDAGWNANVTYVVNDLSRGGSSLYLGGHFTSVGGQPRHLAAAVSTANGALLPWNANLAISSNTVFSVLADGSRVYLGGSFTQVAGVARSRFASVNATTGALDGPNLAPNEIVYTMEKVGNTLLLGGGFTNIAGQARARVAAWDTQTSILHPWAPSFDWSVYDLHVAGATIYVGGAFSTVNGSPNRGLIGVDGAGQVTWDPPDPEATFSGLGSPAVWTIQAVGSTIYAGGEFVEVGGESRRGLAAFDAATAELLPWAPQTSTAIYASGVAGGNFYAGGGDVYGNVMLVNSVERSNVAAFDSEGELTQWAPNPSGAVRALAADDNSVYLGGEFTVAGGQSRSRLAAVDPATGDAQSWNPGANGTVNALTRSGSTIYAGGDFTTAGGQSRSRLVALLSGSSTATAWNPGANATVNALAIHGATVYAGGAFTTAGGQTRNRLAAFPVGSSTATAWNPNANNTVLGLYASPSGRVYAGGSFTTVGGQTRNRLAAFAAGSSTPTAWDPNASGPIWTVAGVGDNVWVGGFFATVGGQPRSHVAGLRPDGTPTTWNPGADASVRAIVVDDSGIHLGGDFDLVAGQSASAYAHFK